MTTATLEIYNALLEAGVSREKAEAAAKAVISRKDTEALLASKKDITDLKAELYKTMLTQTGAIAAIIGILNSILFFAR